MNVRRLWVLFSLLAVPLAGCGVAETVIGSTTLRPPVLVYTTDTPAPPAPASATATLAITADPGTIGTETEAVAVDSEQAIVEVAPSATPEPTATTGPVTLPDGSAYQLVRYAEGFTRPTYVTHAGDGSGRLFVAEQRGVVWVIADGVMQPTPFLDISNRVSTRANEQGLLGLAFAPDFATSGRLFVHYSTIARNGWDDGDTVLSEFSAVGAVADAASERVVLTLNQPFDNHNGGQITFGPDGNLYLGLGDGGRAGDPLGAGQNPNIWLGSIIRINVTTTTTPYEIPPGNPFTNGGGAPEVFVWGLRNPWRFSFDRATGDLYIADVGQGDWEEITMLRWGEIAGANLGWNTVEGPACYASPGCNVSAFVPPVAWYGHGSGNCSVTGGYVYRGAVLPELNGVYFYGDYCSGRIWAMAPGLDGYDSVLFLQTGLNISSFGEDETGELYVVDHNGAVYRLTRQ